MGIISNIIRCEDSSAPPISPTSMIADDGRPELRLPDDPAAFAAHLAEINRGRRREQQRRETRRRKALGI
jgi:hypothetical protein